MTEKEFIAELLTLVDAGLKGNYPAFVDGKKLSRTGQIWYEVFKGCELYLFRNAIMLTIKNETFFPAPADIVRYYDLAKEEDKVNWTYTPEGRIRKEQP